MTKIWTYEKIKVAKTDIDVAKMKDALLTTKVTKVLFKYLALEKLL